MDTQEEKKQHIDFIYNTIQKTLDLIGIVYSLEFQDSGEDSWFVIKTPEAPLLIGDNGKHINALSYIIKKIYENKFSSQNQIKHWFLLDVNDYNKKLIEEIKDSARMHAQRVRYFKKDIEMRPMNSYERRIVHTVLQEYPDIATESVGDGAERRVVIKPLNLI